MRRKKSHGEPIPAGQQAISINTISGAAHRNEDDIFERATKNPNSALVSAQWRDLVCYRA